MKTTGLLIMAGLLLCAAKAMPQDTTLLVNDKRIVMHDDGERLKVRVYEDNEERPLVFEGHYRNGNVYERRERSIHIRLPFRHKSFEPHWDGFGVGFASFADKGMEHINDIGGVSLKGGSSLEYNLNLIEKAFRLGKYSNWAVVTGAGLRWSRYRVDGKFYFKEENKFTGLQPIPEEMDFLSSKLNITSLTIPILLEWQNRSKVFFSAGVAGVIKTMSSSKVTYRNSKGKERTDIMDRGMNLRPVSMDFLVQAGCDWIGAYAKYSPLGLFESGKGPRLHPVSIGLQLHF